MSILPRTVSEFGNASYWESFFKKRGDNPFEWYGDFKTIEAILLKYLKPTDKILQVGCGNSKLAEELCDAGYPNITSFDVVPDVIADHVKNRSKLQPDLKYLVCDATNESAMAQTFSTGSFNVALDKGTLDALLCDESEEAAEKSRRMLSQVLRILSVNGRYVIVTLAQRHVLKFWLEHFTTETEFAYLLRICHLESTGATNFKCPVFLLIATKLRLMPNIKMAYEFSHKPGKIYKYETIDQILNAVAEAQSFALTQHEIQSGKLTKEISVCLHLEPLIQHPRYEVNLVDSSVPVHSRQLYAIFIVPQGREHEWMFGTTEGRKSLASSAGYERLAVVSLHRQHNYKGIDEVKAELSDIAMDFAPLYRGKITDIPFLSLGEDIGERKAVFSGQSDISGDFVVEDVLVSKKTLTRRLVFLQSKNCFQSEAKLIQRKNQTPTVDHSVLLSEYAKMMIGSFAFCEKFLRDSGESIKICVVGLGGGCLPMFIHRNVPKTSIVCVELDPEVLSVAEKFFDLKLGTGLSVHVGDGLKFLEENSGFDIVIIDAAGSKCDIVTCPPLVFLDKEFLLSQRKSLKASGGILVFNIVTRSETKLKEILDVLTEIFPFVCGCRCAEDVNLVVFCGLENNKKLSNPADCEVTLRRCEKILNHNLKRPESKIKFDDLIDGLKHIKLEDSDFAIQNRIQ